MTAPTLTQESRPVTENTRLVHEETFAQAARAGLTTQPKTLPSKYLYDELGSQLFEAICFLPEYYLTRAERALLERDADAIVAGLDPDVRLVELGAGSAVKTSILIRALLARQAELVYCPIDISEEAMRMSQANIVSEFPTVHFKGIIGDWFGALGGLTAMDASQKLVAFLGSSIGNLTDEEAHGFLLRLRESMGPRDHLLLGTDLAKPAEVLVPAYDDAAGVTSAFNKNLLVRMNTELGAHFDTRLFRHEARWNEAEMRIEMHLVSEVEQTVRIDALDTEVHFDAGESIHTENSHKYTIERVHEMASRAGFRVECSWVDDPPTFALHLLAQE